MHYTRASMTSVWNDTEAYLLRKAALLSLDRPALVSVYWFIVRQGYHSCERIS